MQTRDRVITKASSYRMTLFQYLMSPSRSKLSTRSLAHYEASIALMWLPLVLTGVVAIVSSSATQLLFTTFVPR